MQNKLLLLNARTDFSDAVHILTLIKKASVSTSIEDTVYAYMVARDWCKQIADCNTPSCKEDLSSLLKTFKSFAEYFEQEFENREHELVMYFTSFNPIVATLLNSPNERIQELTTLHLRAMLYVADFFATKRSKTWYADLLKSRSVPSDVKL